MTLLKALPRRTSLACLAVLLLPLVARAQLSVSGPRRAVVLFAQFADESAPDSLAPPWSAQIFDPGRRGSLAHYYDTMSFGALALRGEVAPKRYTVSHDAAYYAPGGATGSGRYSDFALDVLRQADVDVDFSRFDADEDGRVDGLFIVVSSTPRNFINAGATGVGNLGLDTTFVTDDSGPGGSRIGIEPAHGTLQRGRSLQEAVGSMAHEYGHVLGLGDLYNVAFAQSDTALPPRDDDAGIGAWGLMGWGASGWPGGDGTPAALSAWSRVRLGWGTVHTPGVGDTTLRLEPVASTGQMMKLPLTATEFFLLEYRTADGPYDRDIPAEGLLVWHIARGVRDSLGSVSRTLVDLECADGRWADAGFPFGSLAAPSAGGDNLDYWAHDDSYRDSHGGNLGDATDPYDGVRATAFTPETNPAAVSRDGSQSLRLEHIRIQDRAVTVAVSLPPPVLEIRDLRVIDDNGDGLVFAGESVAIGLGLVNRGGVELIDVTARVLSEDPQVVLTRPEASFGDLGLAEQALVPSGGFPVLEVGQSLVGIRRTAVTLQLWSAQNLLEERIVPLVVYSPRLEVVAASLVDTAGNGDGTAQPGEIVSVGLEVANPLRNLTQDEARGWQRALRSIELSLVALDEAVRPLDGGRLLLTVDETGPRTEQGAQFLLPADLQPADLQSADLGDAPRLRFQVVLASEFGAWYDTVAVPFAPGPDRTAPRVRGPTIGREREAITFWLPPSRVQEGGAIASVNALIYRYEDTTRVAQMELTADEDGAFVGRVEVIPEGAYLVRVEVLDDAGNIGRSALQVLTTIRAPILAGPGSADGGWVRLAEFPASTPVEPTRVLLSPSDSRVVYLLSQRGLWRSDDGGDVWQAMSHMGLTYGPDIPRNSIAMDAGDPYRLYTLGARPLVSDDGGASWRELANPDPSFVLLATSPGAPGRLHGTLNTGGTPHRALLEDGGATWSISPATDVPLNIQENPADPDEVYAGFQFVYDTELGTSRPGDGWHSVDGGLTWERFPGRSLNTWVVDGTQPGRLFGANGDTILVSRDHGRTWGPLSQLPSGQGSLRLSAHPHVSQLVANTSSRAWVSTDAGIQWEPIEIGVPVTAILQQAQDPARMFVIRSGLGLHVARSVDQGRTWKDRDLPEVAPAAGTVLFDQAGRLIAGSGLRAQGGGVSPSLALLGEDGTWEWRVGAASPFGAREPEASGLLIDPFDPSQMLAMHYGRLLRTEDAGYSWAAVPQRSYLIAPGQPMPVLAHPRRAGYYVRPGVMSLDVSHDHGQRWEQSLNYGDLVFYRAVALDPEDIDLIYAAVQQDLWRSPDAGKTWETDFARLGFEPRLLAFGPPPTLHMYAVTQSAVYRSPDRGRTWAMLADIGTTQVEPTRLRFDPREPDRFFLVGASPVRSESVLETRDGGLTWTDVATGTSPRLRVLDVAVDPLDGQLYAATPWGVYRHAASTGTAVDGHETLPAVFHLGASFPNPFNTDTVIPFAVDATRNMELVIHNLAGQKVRTLLDEERRAGAHQVRWDGRNEDGQPVGSGVYFYSLRVGAEARVRRMLLLK